MYSNTITRPALGRPASLGDLYDIRSETFKDIMIFKKHPIPSSAIKIVECPRVDMQFIKTESFSEKFNKLKVSADFNLSLLAGFFPLSSGTGEYLQQEKASARKATTTLMYSIETVTETLNINNEGLIEFICQKTLSATDATHIVIRVDWGANVFLSFQDNSGSFTNNYSLSSKVEAKFINLEARLVGEGDGKSADNMEQLALRVYGDILPAHGKIPQSTKEANEFIQSIPNLAKESNNGKGKPISYGLVPIAELRRIFGIETEEIIWREVADDVSQKIVYFFDNLLELKQKLTDLYEDVVMHSYCFNESTLKQVRDIQHEFLIFESSAKIKLREIVGNVRSGNNIETNSCEYLKETNNLDEKGRITVFEEFLASKSGEFNHIQWIKTLISKNVTPIGLGETKTIDMAIVGQPLQNNSVNKVFLYAFRGDDDVPVNNNRLAKNKNLFLQLLSGRHETAKFYFANYDIYPVNGEGKLKGNSSIYYFVDGNLKCEDWLEDSEKKMNIPIVGTYKLKDNGEFPTYLTELGIGSVHAYGICAAKCKLVITENNGLFTIETKTTFKNLTQTFQLKKEFSELTAIDGLQSQSIMTRDLNRLILTQKVSDGTKRVIIRKFLEKQMIVTLKLLPGKLSGKEISVTRVFDRKLF